MYDRYRYVVVVSSLPATAPSRGFQQDFQTDLTSNDPGDRSFKLGPIRGFTRDPKFPEIPGNCCGWPPGAPIIYQDVHSLCCLTVSLTAVRQKVPYTFALQIFAQWMNLIHIVIIYSINNLLKVIITYIHTCIHTYIVRKSSRDVIRWVEFCICICDLGRRAFCQC